MQPDDPATLAELTPEFLTRVVNAQCGGGAGRVAGFELEPSARGFGSLSIQRIHIVRSPPAGETAASLVLKVLGTYQFPPDAPQAAIDRYRTDQIREMNFYKGRLERPLPECLHRPEPLYVIDRDEIGQRWIFMEDLGDFIPGPEQSIGDSLRAVTNLAALHAQWWERSDLLDRHDWLAPVTQDTTLWEGLAREQLESNLERAARHPDLRHLYTDERLALIRRLAERWKETHAQVESLPQTLIHGDFGAHNFGYRELNGKGQTVLVDWDQVGVGTPGMELGRSNWLPALLGAEHVPADLLLDTYTKSLEKWLGKSIDPDAIREGYDLYFCLAGLFLLAFYAVGEGPNELIIPIRRVAAGTARVLSRMERAARRWL